MIKGNLSLISSDSDYIVITECIIKNVASSNDLILIENNRNFLMSNLFFTFCSGSLLRLNNISNSFLSNTYFLNNTAKS